MTLRKYAAGWVEAYPADSTRGEQIRRQLANHILPKLGGKTLAELERRPSAVQQFLNGLPMGPGGASQVAITLSTILNAAVDDQLITRNPCKAQSVKLPRQPKSSIRPWTMAQAEEIRAGLPGRWQAVVDCGDGLGMRQGRSSASARRRSTSCAARSACGGRSSASAGACGSRCRRAARSARSPWRSACRSGWPRTSRTGSPSRSRSRGTSRATRDGTASRSHWR